MGNKERYALYHDGKALGLDVKSTMSETALREILDKHSADQEKMAKAEQKRLEKKLELEAARVAEEEAMAKAVADTRAKAEAEAIAKAEAEAIEEAALDEELADEDVEIVFENGDDEEEDYETSVVFDIPKPSAKPKPPVRKRVLEARYFPTKKKSKSEDPYEIYKAQMNKAKAKKKKKN